jgi:hypothetical protein
VHKSIYYKSHTVNFTTVLPHTVGDKKVKQLLSTTVHSLMIGQ